LPTIRSESPDPSQTYLLSGSDPLDWSLGVNIAMT